MAFDLQFVDSIGDIYAPITDTFTRYVPTALNANPFFETDVSNWTPTGGTFVRSTAQFHEGVASGLLTPDGVTAIVRVECAAASGAVAGQSYSASAWVRCAVARDVQITINWFDAGGTYLSTSSATPVAVAANTWTLLQFVAVAPASTGMVSMNVQMSGTPAITDLLYVDEARLTTGGGWGSADTGQVWTSSGGVAADYSTDGTSGLISAGSVNVERRMLVDTGSTDQQIQLWLTLGVTPTGAPINWGGLLRYVDANNYYWVDVQVETGGALTLRLVKRVGGTLTQVTTVASGQVHSTVTPRVLKAQIVGDTVKARVWPSDETEPTTWQMSFTDRDLPAGTQAGAICRLATGNTNTLPVPFAFDNVSGTSPTQVRLDLNDDLPWRTLGEGTEFGTPPLRRAVVSTLMQDGEHIPAATFGNRMLSLTLDCQLAATDFDGAATAFQELSRELDRVTNFVRYRPGTTAPVFFRTLRSDFTSVVWDAVLRRASVSVLAEPFAYGLPEFLPAVTVYNDPAEGTTLNANPYFETDVSNWTATGGTFVRSTAQFHQGVASGLLTPDGVTAAAVAKSETVPATVGTVYRASAWVRCASTRNVQINIDWRTAGGTLISTSSSIVAVTANTWTLLDVTGTAPATTGLAGLTVSMTGTPPITDLLYVDEARIRQSGGVGGMCFDVTGIKGDVPAATKIATDLAFYDNRMLTATRRRGTPANLQFAYQAEAMTQGTDTTTQPNDAAMSGAGNNFSRCTFATATTMQTRLTIAAFPSSAVDGRGLYRVLVRVRKSVSGDVINMQMVVNATLLNKTTLNTTTSTYHEDLGLLSVPFGTDPVTDGPSGMELDVTQYAVGLQAERVSGTGTLDIDYVLFIPADDELTFVEFGPDTFGDGYIFDSHHDMVYAVKAGAVDTSDDIIPVAGLPTLRPGVTNRIYIVQGVDVTETVTATCTAAVTTWPCYLNVRGTS